jgi:aerobic carbon-monoxide dehydrogenase large subunit
MATTVGRSVLPTELAELTTGDGRYLADLRSPETLRAAFVRSVYGHGTIKAVRAGAAELLPGVVRIFTAEDLDLVDLAVTEVLDGVSNTFRRPILARQGVRFAGEAIALVVAEDEYVAADGVDLVEVDIEPAQAVMDLREAMSGTAILFPDVGTNVVTDVFETLGTPPGEWPVSVTIEARNQRVAAAPIETISLMAIPGDSPRLTVWCGHQGPHELRERLAEVLGLDDADIRVRVPRVGGAFGLKGVFHPEYAVVAAAALKLGRSVSWIADRREELIGATHGRSQFGRITLSGEASGRIRRADIELIADLGAYPHHGGELLSATRLMATGPYDIGQLTIRSRAIVTNRAPIGPYRGAGRPEAAYLLERAIDAYARKTGVDPADARRMNFISPGALPHRTPTGATYDSGDYGRALDQALQLAQADDVRREQRRRRATGADPIGLGIGVYMDRSGGGLTDGEYSRVEVLTNGSIVVRTGSTSSGQGHATIWRQVVGDALGVPAERITFVAGDTAEVARGIGTFGSRSTQLGASAAARSAASIVDRARAFAVEHLEARAEDLELVDGGFNVVGVPAVGISLAQIAGHLAEQGESLAAEEYFIPGALTFPYGVFVAVVEVERSTGRVSVRHVAAVNDCGILVNPELASDQVLGSIMQGIGQALYEEIVYDDAGQQLSSTFMDYLVPTASESTRVSLGWIEIPAPSNPLGVKGIAESGCIGVPQAIVNAVLDALAPWDVTDLQMPLQAHRVWEAIRQAERSAAAPDPGRGAPE